MTTTTTTMTETATTAETPVVLSEAEAEAALNRFCRFLQFETVSSTAPETGAYRECAAWLVHELQAADCFDEIFYLPEAPDHSPVVVAVWKGIDTTLPVLLWNSHYDVVPATDFAEWKVPPFSGIRHDGIIHGRGTQDMKSVCIQYIAALQYIHQHDPDWKPARSMYLTFVPDEEVGGAGMAAFLESELYRSLPGIALALDEGLASTKDSFPVFYGERLPWWVTVTAKGPAGHGSRFIEHTAVEQLLELTQKAMVFRTGQRSLLGLDDHSNCAHVVAAAAQVPNTTTTTISPAPNRALGDVTSLNITRLEAGVRVGNTYAYNCIPSVAECSMDIRISPHTAPTEISRMLDQWCQECSRTADYKVTWSFIEGHGNDHQTHAVTSIDTDVNPWYAVFAHTLQQAGYKVKPQVFPAATDSRFLRALGIRALGFSPMRRTSPLLHETNECIPEAVFLEGIVVYVVLLKALASQGGDIEGPSSSSSPAAAAPEPESSSS